ncbi:MAG: histone deacetylase [Bacteroidetes bacterium]|nr:MAG: histone deacetylase [Bacteroidota bacterium]
MLRIAYKKSFSHPLPEGHRFPMLKYDLIPQQLLHQGIVSADQFFEPTALSTEVLFRTHDQAYYQSLKDGSISAKAMRKIGFPPSPALLERELEICQGTLDCAYHALEYGVGMNVAGGTHHAYADSGEGFCIFNDFAVAANQLLFEGKVNNVLIIDLDVHQGNGTARIMQDEPRVFTFSMHGQANYPMHKEKSDWDIALATDTGDEEYLDVLAKALAKLKSQNADLVFYQCGVDVLGTDKLGKLNLSKEACAERDRMVFRFCKERGLPAVAAMGGGYSPQIADIVDAHVRTFEIASDLLGG